MTMEPIHILRGAVACAIQAPSSHNSQPWRFRRVGDRLEIRADLERHLEVIDPLKRQLLVSVGCALYNARVALRAAGYAGAVELFPDPADPALIARLRLGLPRSPSDDDRVLLDAIGRRHTNRRPFLDRPVGEDVSDALIHAARAERTTLVRLSPVRKRELAELVAECDRRRFGEASYREQVGEWLVPAGRWRKDGIPFAEKEYGSSAWFGLRRTLDEPALGQHVGSIERDRVVSAPMVAVFATAGDDDLDYVDCGQALEAVLLRATALGLSAAFVDQLLEFEDLHTAVTTMLPPDRVPQMVVRFGYAPPVERIAPRRDLADVFEELD